MRLHCALWPAGRARGVTDRRQRRGVDRDRGRCRKVGGDQRIKRHRAVCDVIAKRDDRTNVRDILYAHDGSDFVRRCNDRRGAAIPDDILDFIGSQHGVDRIDDSTEPGDGIVAHDPFPGVWSIKGHGVAGRDAKVGQPTGSTLDEIVEFVEGERASLEDQRLPVSEPGGCGCRNLADVIEHRVPLTDRRNQADTFPQRRHASGPRRIVD